MKRGIKFRGRSVHGGWFYGDLLHYTNPLLPSKINGEAIIVTDYTSESDNKFKIINPDTIGQFTGLKDKNGKDIYEGDIVEWLFFYTIHSSNGANGEREELLKGVIEWRQGGFVFRVLENDFENAGWYSISDLHTETLTDVEVIGNIHDNPELLTEK